MMNRSLSKSIQKIRKEAEAAALELEYKELNDKSLLIINAKERKMVLMTINALDAKSREVLYFGISVRKSNWSSMIKNYSEMELIGRLSNGPFKSLTKDKIITFIS